MFYLPSPKFKEGDVLKVFDYVVANPPFSDKRWSNGIDSLHDPFDMDTEMAALETKLAKARQLNQRMMQELLTGRIRLPVDGRSATA